MHTGCRLTLCFTILIALGLAMNFAIPAGIDFPRQRSEAKAYWKTNCIVTDCRPFEPQEDTVWFESREYFRRGASAIFTNGCALHPINSTLVCYVNAHTLRLKKPGGISGLVCLVFASVLCGIAVITGLVWIGLLVVECIIEHRTVTTLPAPIPVQHSSTPTSSGHSKLREDE